MKRRALLTLSVATTLSLSHAHAQEAANQSALEEIIVTARQREEKIEDVPVDDHRRSRDMTSADRRHRAAARISSP